MRKKEGCQHFGPLPINHQIWGFSNTCFFWPENYPTLCKCYIRIFYGSEFLSTIEWSSTKMICFCCTISSKFSWNCCAFYKENKLEKILVTRFLLLYSGGGGFVQKQCLYKLHLFSGFYSTNDTSIKDLPNRWRIASPAPSPNLNLFR